MKANELMIGDWVAIGNNFIRVTSLQVSRNYPEANPIPLTPEILEKNGWKYNPTIKAYEWQHEAFYISIKLDGKTRIYVVNDYIFGMALGAVHELQHALRLCGIDKEIVL